MRKGSRGCLEVRKSAATTIESQHLVGEGVERPQHATWREPQALHDVGRILDPQRIAQAEVGIVVQDAAATPMIVCGIIEQRTAAQYLTTIKRDRLGLQRGKRQCAEACEYGPSAQKAHFLSQLALLLEVGGNRPQCRPASTINTSPVTTLAPSRNHTRASAICSAVGTVCSGTMAAALTRNA